MSDLLATVGCGPSSPEKNPIFGNIACFGWFLPPHIFVEHWFHCCWWNSSLHQSVGSISFKNTSDFYILVNSSYVRADSACLLLQSQSSLAHPNFHRWNSILLVKSRFLQLTWSSLLQKPDLSSIVDHTNRRTSGSKYLRTTNPSTC